MSIPLIRLHKFIVDHYDLEQLRALCVDLDVGYDDLGNKGLDHQVHELILRLGRQRQFDHLLRVLGREHPDPFGLHGFRVVPAALRSLYAALASFDASYALTGDTLSILPTVWPIAPPEPFVGHKQKRNNLIYDLCHEGEVYTLVGIAGIGKTALAAWVIREFVEVDIFTGGVLWLSLDAASTICALWVQIGVAYGYSPSINAAEIARVILDQHRPLLVIDNAEAAPGVARALLEGRGTTTVLLITRDRAIAAEYSDSPHQIGPLDHPDAVELFRVRAGVDHDAALVDELCKLVDNLPLAISLAAGHVANYDEPLANYVLLLEKKLRLAARRDASVSVTFDLIYACLDDDRQLALAVLALDGGETSAPEAVAAGAGWEDVTRARAACDDLVRCFLLTHENDAWRIVNKDRYRLHPLLRRCAIEKREMDSIMHTGIRARLAAHYLAHATTHEQPTAADHDALHAERLNILAAMDHVYRQEQWVRVRRFAWALCRPVSGYLSVRGYWDECHARLEQAIHAAKEEGNKQQIAALVHDLAVLTQRVRDWDEARRLYHLCLDINEELGNQANVADSLHRLGSLARIRDDHVEARRLLHSSLDIRRGLGDQIGIANTLHNLAMTAQETDNYAEAYHLYRTSLSIKEELGEQEGVAVTLHELGNLVHLMGDQARARQLYHSSMNIQKKLENQVCVLISLGQLANLANEEGDQDEAESLYWQAITLGRELGDVVETSTNMLNLALLYEDQNLLNKALSLLERAMEIIERVGSPHKDVASLALDRVQGKLALMIFTDILNLRKH